MDLVEKGVVSAILFEPNDLNVVVEVLVPEDFEYPRNATIFSKMLEFHRDGKVVDPLLLADSLDRDGKLSQAGGIEYFLELSDTSALWAAGDVLSYALVIQENSRLRKLQRFAHSVQEKTLHGSGADSSSIVEYAYQNLQRLAIEDSSQDERTLTSLADEMIDDVIEKSERDPSLAFTGIPTGFIDIDHMTNGFQPGQMVIVAGRPAMGKSTLALNIASSAALYANKTVLFYSLEMTRKELMMKLLSSIANVPYDVVKKGVGLTRKHVEAMRKARDEMDSKNLIIRDSFEVSVSQLRAQCVMQKASPEGLDMVVVDHIGLMNTNGLSASSRQEEISEISRSIKLLAKELQVPIMTLAQLNRGNEKSADKTPMVSNLRESGALEQDADIIMMVHRPEVYDPNDKPGITELIVGKHRGGETGTIELLSLLEYSKFANSAGKYIAQSEPPLNEEDEEMAPPPPDDYYDAPEGVPEASVPSSSGAAW